MSITISGYQLWVAVFFIQLLTSCHSEDRSTSSPPSHTDTLTSGYILSQQYCSNCHLHPSPDALPKATWRNYVLPRMGYRLGVFSHDSIRSSLLETGLAGQRVAQAGIYPQQPVISPEDWQEIQNYYLGQAPDSLFVDLPKIAFGLPHFKIHIPTYRLSPPSTTLIDIHRQQLYLGDANTRRLYRFDSDLRLLTAANVREGAVSVTLGSQQLLVTTMGSFSPTDYPQGMILALPRQPDQPPKILLDSLQRPVHTAVADLNQDGLPDFVVSEYGKWLGALSWWQQLPTGKFKKHTLRPQPGAIVSYVRDLNQDGLPDILALFGQGDEGVFAYYNQGKGQFREEALLRFPPSYGSSSLLLIDVDQDGDEDLVYTAGDNADYPPVVKPYHGVYVFNNDGSYHFTESFFYPLPGAYRAIPADYDQDGDLDIATIAFFPDYSLQPEAGFAYLQNQGDDTFQPLTFEPNATGRWLVMDTGDLDGDGDLDIALGSLAFEVVPPNSLLEQWVTQGIPFVVLENTVITPSATD